MPKDVVVVEGFHCIVLSPDVVCGSVSKWYQNAPGEGKKERCDTTSLCVSGHVWRHRASVQDKVANAAHQTRDH